MLFPPFDALLVAIHSDYDPRPSEAVRLPLQAGLPTVEFVEIERCGHKPWQETQAKDAFFRPVKKAIA